MRNGIHAARDALVIVPLLLVATLTASVSLAAERRLIVTAGADYPGHDFSTLKDVDLEACRSACLADAACRAFTFNTKAGWCFLKSDFGGLAATADAVAGRVVESPELTPTLERRRLAELGLLSDDLLDEARALVGDLKRRHAGDDASFLALRASAALAYRGSQYDQAALAYGRALAIADENAGAWLDLAEASLARNPANWSDRQSAAAEASGAAINAHLRGETAPDRARALALLGAALAKREIWKPAIRAYRAGLAIAEVAPVRAAYEAVVATHGFRIISHEVEADSATPQICVRFSDALAVMRLDLSDYVTVTGGEGLAIEPQESQICIDGVKHGGRYVIRVRGGLPAADGETLPHPVELGVYVRDRAPWVGFAGNAYILPAGAGASIPISSVNTDSAKATIYRIGDRAIAEAVRDGSFMSQLSRYTAERIAGESGELVWSGEIDIQSKLNETVTTAIPITQALPRMLAGAYAITAAPTTGKLDEWGPIATQWFVVSDLGLTALSANDGVHALIRSLASAKPVAGAKVRLIAVNNEILGETVSDENGYARFEPGLARGAGGMTPQLVVAETGDDYAFIDLDRPAFDLTDRGVAGRSAPTALDTFLTPERGIYRPGETVHLTALVRDARAVAVAGLPLTLVVERPDGVEFLRTLLSDTSLGGYTHDVELAASAMRGSWRVRLHADPKGPSLGETSVLVEDFEPERLTFALTTAVEAFDLDEPATIDLEARYLWGAPAPDLAVEGEVTLKPIDGLAAYPGYWFGLAEEGVTPRREPLAIDTVTDADGKARFAAALPEPSVSTHPFEAELIVRLADTNGRAVERRLSHPVKPASPMIGVRPLFGGDVNEGATAGFEAILVAADGTRAAKAGVGWALERLESDYQWYQTNGRWTYEVITNAARVDGGMVDIAADRPATISARVDWGRYRLTVEDDRAPAATSVEFYAGWYRPVSTSETPDTLEVGLDKPAYRSGETARLRLNPRFPGVALITVVDDRLIAMRAVEVPEGGTTVDLEVTEAWGAGAYVTATLYRPMDIAAKRMPARALGLTWAKVAPGERQLSVALDLPDETRPRQPLTIPVAIGNLPAGAEARVTIAAVDVGILNLTNFETPAPDAWYFGQRRLGMEIRDVYGLLIDRMQGVPGAVRSGGDGGPVRLAAPPPTQKLVAHYSGILTADADGKVSVAFDIPDFNGTVRVMAMAWTSDGVGHAAKDVIVRDPVVVTASIPRFLSLGDSSRLLVEVNNVAGPAGDYRLTVATGDGIEVADVVARRPFHLDERARTAITLPMTATAIGDFDVIVSLAAPSGEEYPTSLALGVRPAGQPVTKRSLITVAGGGSLLIDPALTEAFVPGTGSVAVSLGGAGPLDVAGILAALDRYPYGCVEQLTSRAMPLVYLDDVAISVGIGADQIIRERVEKAIAGVLADQAASGAFGLWGPEGAGGDLWLDAYVTDFITRAAENGYRVPELARELALDNLANAIAYAGDFESGGEDIAYALYVLARSGRAAIGDLRYYADSKLDNFRTPLAKAEVGAAMALYGDRPRAERAFAAAMADLDRAEATEGW
ncbi:MAG: alpha-2-macroglobulin family protein, partial [Bauldia sp.]